MDTNAHIYRFLDRIANTVGNTITEYHWREACELMKLIEDEGLVEKEHEKNQTQDPNNINEW